MEPTLTLKHTNPAIAGSFPFPPFDTLNGHELHLIKTMSGVRAGELEEALEAGDFDVILAFAAVALRRAGRKVPSEALLDLKPADVEAAGAYEEEDHTEDPLPGSADLNGSGASQKGSGATSAPRSASPPSPPSRTGPPPSATTAT